VKKQTAEQEKEMKQVTFYRPRFLENTLSDFDRYLDSFFGDNFLAPATRAFNRSPSVDIRETENAYVLEAELPGFDEKDIEIHLDGNTLTIQSKKEETAEGETAQDSENSGADRGYLVRERRTSSFCRSFKMPENADREAISASFKNGILGMEIAKKPEAQKRVIQITA